MTICSHCGSEILPNNAFCVRCGAPVNHGFASDVSVPNQTKGYSFIVTLILCWVFGIFGVHRFYTGNTDIGVGQLLTCGGLGIWSLIDFIQIINGSYRDGMGRPLVHDE